jgi:diguanylate cyclase (GGDEF)-like protein
MSSILLESIANTTMQRDKAGVHAAIAQLLLQYLGAKHVAMYRMIVSDDERSLVPFIEVSSEEEIVHAAFEAELARIRLDDVPELALSACQREIVQYAAAADDARAVLPILLDREVRGLIVIHTAARIEERDMRHVAALIRILTNHLALLDYGERDTLTGMLNRKTYEATFVQIRRHGAAMDGPAETTTHGWVGLIDIDKFKSINDTHGHLFGDEVLLLVSQLMAKCFRGSDLLFRFGGEEFIVVLERATIEGARIAFERLRKMVDDYAFPQNLSVTISLGYTSVLADDIASACTERADAALYYAKHHGRNNIRRYEYLVAAGELSDKRPGNDAELF